MAVIAVMATGKAIRIDEGVLEVPKPLASGSTLRGVGGVPDIVCAHGTAAPGDKLSFRWNIRSVISRALRLAPDRGCRSLAKVVFLRQSLETKPCLQ